MFSNILLHAVILTMEQPAAGEKKRKDFTHPKAIFVFQKNISECFAATIHCATQTGASVKQYSQTINWGAPVPIGSVGTLMLKRNYAAPQAPFYDFTIRKSQFILLVWVSL